LSLSYHIKTDRNEQQAWSGRNRPGRIPYPDENRIPASPGTSRPIPVETRGSRLDVDPDPETIRAEGSNHSPLRPSPSQLPPRIPYPGSSPPSSQPDTPHPPPVRPLSTLHTTGPFHPPLLGTSPKPHPHPDIPFIFP
jgi:hypothetical protein